MLKQLQFGLTLDHTTENNLIPAIFDGHFGLHQQDDADAKKKVVEKHNGISFIELNVFVKTTLKTTNFVEKKP